MENDKLSAHSIRSLLKEDDYNIRVYDTVDSTNTMLKENALALPDKTIIVAKNQTAGRGSKGRSFQSPNTGIYFSILLKPDDISANESIMFTIIAAVAVSKSIEDITGKAVGIKWVNDIFMNNRKVCGILTEGSVTGGNLLQYAVVGIGINITRPKGGFDSSIEDIAGAILPSGSDLNTVACKLVASTVNYFFCYYSNFNKREYVREYREHLFILGQRIYLEEDNRQVLATAVDIDDDCHLIVKTDNGDTKTLPFGEVSIRPI